MKHIIAIGLLMSCSLVLSQSIENVDFYSEGQTIVVTFDFEYFNPDTLVNLELNFKDQQGSAVLPKTLHGDLKNVRPGQNKRIVWDVLSDEIQLSGKYIAEVKIIQFSSAKIGNQIWMSENLDLVRFQNGDAIPEARSSEDWERAGREGKPVWCHYNYDASNALEYGKLYNWYAVNDSRGLAPEGWHVPSKKEWTNLTRFLGGENYAGKYMKNTYGWNDYEGYNGNGTNESGFSGFPGGHYLNGIFSRIGSRGYYWSSSQFGKNVAWNFYLFNGSFRVYRSYDNKLNGLSVRCIKD